MFSHFEAAAAPLPLWKLLGNNHLNGTAGKKLQSSCSEQWIVISMQFAVCVWRIPGDGFQFVSRQLQFRWLPANKMVNSTVCRTKVCVVFKWQARSHCNRSDFRGKKECLSHTFSQFYNCFEQIELFSIAPEWKSSHLLCTPLFCLLDCTLFPSVSMLRIITHVE